MTTQETLRQLRHIVNNLTPENFDELMKSVADLNFDTGKKLREAIKLIFFKAVLEPNYTTLYVKMCCCLKEVSCLRLASSSSSDASSCSSLKSNNAAIVALYFPTLLIECIMLWSVFSSLTHTDTKLHFFYKSHGSISIYCCFDVNIDIYEPVSAIKSFDNNFNYVLTAESGHDVRRLCHFWHAAGDSLPATAKEGPQWR